ncbi:glycosyltransferase family 2 protein [Candidatus Cetobacterium colombiensis]|uniref:Glycosyltransferase family 2 protein n=1 Tax=Candidatus Cetobacterium colombiensis TaxID=3073100 RepID=A0ABU4W9Z7_9FUSO|nr:glycosyltransferase family 2 protein [Candidatus Cetobacterium colombiensis]MDX8336363.1 glycosyltransferase family 2 protein [Candidatus Cetobacterium colombiensis]
MKISVAMITFNEEKILKRTLESVKGIADEIVIVDSGSTDLTEEIAKEYNAKFHKESWKGYGPQRNSAIEKCKGEWILNIDADEEISEELKDKILSIINDEQNKKEIFKINRLSVCFGKKLKHGGWGTSYAIRLFKKGSGLFNDNTVHEAFETNKEIFKIKENIYHHSYLTMEDYFNRFNRYTTEGAKDYYRKKKKVNIFDIAINPIYKFVKMYIFRLGFLDGVEGFVIASTSSLYSMIKYFKLREMYKNGSYLQKDNNIKNR